MTAEAQERTATQTRDLIEGLAAMTKPMICAAVTEGVHQHEHGVDCTGTLPRYEWKTLRALNIQLPESEAVQDDRAD